MADFAHIQSVQTVVGEGGKALLQLRVAGSQELLQVQWWGRGARLCYSSGWPAVRSCYRYENILILVG